MAQLAIVALAVGAQAAATTALSGLIGAAAAGAIGYAAGSLLGSYLFSKKIRQDIGPRIKEVSVPVASPGSGISQVNGTIRVRNCPIIWADGLRGEEVTQDSGGKGGGGGTVSVGMNYFISVAVGICDDEINDLQKIFMDTKLVYDVSDTGKGKTVDQIAYRSLKIYKGTADQVPDPTMYSYLREDTPFYKGYTYFVFDDLSISYFGNRIPSIEPVIVRTSNANGSGIKKTSQFDWVGTEVTGTKSLSVTNETQQIHRVVTRGTDTTIETYDIFGQYIESQKSFPTERLVTRNIGSVGGNGYFNVIKNTPFKTLSVVATLEPNDADEYGNGPLTFGVTDGALIIFYTADNNYKTIVKANYTYTFDIYKENIYKLPNNKYFSTRMEFLFKDPAGNLTFYHCSPEKDFEVEYMVLYTTDLLTVGFSGAEKGSLEKFANGIYEVVAVGGSSVGAKSKGGSFHKTYRLEYNIRNCMDCFKIDSKTFGYWFLYQGQQYQSTFLARLDLSTAGFPMTEGWGIGINGAKPLDLFIDDVTRKVYCLMSLNGRAQISQKSIDNPSEPPFIQEMPVEFLFNPADAVMGFDTLDRCIFINGKSNLNKEAILRFFIDTKETAIITNPFSNQETTVFLDTYVNEIITFEDNEIVSSDGNLRYSYYNSELNDYNFYSPSSQKYPIYKKMKVRSLPFSTRSFLRENLIKTGLKDENIDVDLIPEDDVINGYEWQGQTSAKSIIGPIVAAKFIDTIESGYKIKFIPRINKLIVADIPEGDFGAQLENNPESANFSEYFSYSQKKDTDITNEIEVSYIDLNTDYDKGVQSSKKFDTINNINKASIELPIVLNADEAKYIANIYLSSNEITKNQYLISVDFKYAYLEPTDLIYINYSDNKFLCRIVSKEENNGVINLILQDEYLEIYNQSHAEGVSVLSSSQNLKTLVPSKSIFLDIPRYRSQDSENGFYYGTSPYYENNNVEWTGSILFKNLNDDNNEYKQISTNTKKTYSGYCIEKLDDCPFKIDNYNYFDNQSSVTVKINTQLHSVTFEELTQGKNKILIGKEIIQYKDAEMLDENTYKLTNLLRGCFGTNYAMLYHSSDESCVILNDSSFKIVNEGNSFSVNKNHIYKNATIGISNLDTVIKVPFINKEIGTYPYIVNKFEINRDSLTKDINFNIIPTLKMITSISDGMSVPADNTGRKYAIEIYKTDFSTSTGDSLVRTIIYDQSNSSNFSAVEQIKYSAEDQLSDFGNYPTGLTLKIYKFNINYQIVGFERDLRVNIPL